MNIQKKIADLSLALTQCIDDIAIPEITFQHHPLVIEAAAYIRAKNENATDEDVKNEIEKLMMPKLLDDMDLPYQLQQVGYRKFKMFFYVN